ncbi:hypothetical protein ABT124_07470 [Streptomyces sp. NPDC001982]|uniref:hypothetical protein n=1 Tax=unclassified Streptomyces TaxID=2593676 RepID=UPI003325BA56
MHRTLIVRPHLVTTDDASSSAPVRSRPVVAIVLTPFLAVGSVSNWQFSGP